MVARRARARRPARLVEGAWLGRGEPAAGDGERLQFAPSHAAGGPPHWLEASRLARQQLRFREVSEESALVESSGRCPLAVNGSPVVSARIKPGDVVTLR